MDAPLIEFTTSCFQWDFESYGVLPRFRIVAKNGKSVEFDSRSEMEDWFKNSKEAVIWREKNPGRKVPA